jgi:AraC-like DNA-binding protein
MRYDRTETPEPAPQFLSVVRSGHTYAFSVLHAALEEVHAHEPRSHEHAHALYHVVLYTRGDNEMLLGGERIPVRPGSLVLTSPGELHDFAPAAPGSVGYREVTFALESARGPLTVPFATLLGLYAGRRLESRKSPQKPADRTRRKIDGVFQGLLERLLAHSLGVYQSMMDLFQVLIAELYQNEPETLDAIGRVHRAIEDRYAERLRLADLAHDVHLSSGHLSRVFSARYGVAPIAYQNRLRLEAARSMLAATDRSCKQIADALGFADVFTFSKAFKKGAGVGPRAFRRG